VEEASSKEIPIACMVPECGQLVEVRRRQWIVADISKSSISTGNKAEQHLVTLSSLDDDAVGDELQVIWQLEPGAQVLETAGLPSITGFDSHEKLEAFLDAVRWGAVTNADRSFLQAPFRSGISIEDYQLDPLVRAVDMARANLLIADDVGLGKTIEAGLVIQELLVRHRARTVMVVCPASLQIKWQTEMQEKFGLEFRIVDTDYVKKLRRERGIHVNPWTSYPRLISSMDWMKCGEGYRLIKDILPPHIAYPRKFDILVVDEAHNVAPSSACTYSIESQRTKLIRSLAPHFSHRIFLTATPHNGYQESFTSLLELLDDQRFARTVMPDEKQLQRVMVRRLKSDIVDHNGNPIFPKRKLKCLEVNYSEDERQIHNVLHEFTKERLASIKGTRFAYGSEFVYMLLKKRLFSSPLAFAITLSKHKETLEKGITRISDQAKLDDRILRKAIQKTEEEYSDDTQVEDAQNDVVEAASELAPALTDKQKDLLNQLSNWAEKSRNNIDSKAKAIIDWIEEFLKTGGQWNGKRVILFTEYRATHAWLHQILTAHGYGGDRLMFLHGGMSGDDREVVKAAFQAHPDISPVRILLATDAASEGIDLQNHCNFLIHIEIPWNPNVMEQRNGRIDRHGQKASEVMIWHPVGRGFIPTLNAVKASPGNIEGDHEYLMRAALKIDTIREDLGSVGSVIATQIVEAMLGRRTNLDTTAAEIKAASAKKFVATEKRLQERIAKMHEKILETKTDFHLSPARVFRAVSVALELAQKPPLKEKSGTKANLYEVPVLPGSWGRSTIGLEHPHTGVRRPITFDHEVAKGNDNIVLAHLNHRLVQMSLQLLREEVWKLDDVKHLHRVAFYCVPDDLLSDMAVLVWSRLVITGGDHRRLHEELTLSGGELKNRSYSRIHQISRLEILENGLTPIEPTPELLNLAKDRFANNEQAILSAVEARSRDRLKSLTNIFAKRVESEINDIVSVLDELEASIKRELKTDREKGQLYLPGFSPDEMAQIKKDYQALESRLARIPGERIEERSVIEKHYANPVERTFPAAVIFLVPKSETEGMR